MNPMQMEPPPFSPSPSLDSIRAAARSMTRNESKDPGGLAPPFPQIQRKEDYSEVKRMLQRTSNFSPAAVSQDFRRSNNDPVDVGLR
jgi:hypothetical protein